MYRIVHTYLQFCILIVEKMHFNCIKYKCILKKVSSNKQQTDLISSNSVIKLVSKNLVLIKYVKVHYIQIKAMNRILASKNSQKQYNNIKINYKTK